MKVKFLFFFKNDSKNCVNCPIVKLKLIYNQKLNDFEINYDNIHRILYCIMTSQMLHKNFNIHILKIGNIFIG